MTHNKEIADSITIFLAEITDAVEDCDWDEIVDVNFFPKMLYKTYLSRFTFTRESFIERIAQQDALLSNHAHDVKIGQLNTERYKKVFPVLSTEEKQQKIAEDLLEFLSVYRLSKKDIEDIARTVYQLIRHAKRTAR